jgi:hypothetical protein
MNCLINCRPAALLLLVGTLTSQAYLRGALLDFALIPTAGRLTAAPGDTVGWGYTLANNSRDQWLVPTVLNSDPFLYGQPMSLFDFPVLSPGASVSLSFDPVQMTGFYRVTVAPNAPFSFIEQGTFTVAFEWWSGDPARAGALLDQAPDASTPWRVEIISDVPEPSYLLILCLALPALYWVRRNIYRRLEEDQ